MFFFVGEFIGFFIEKLSKGMVGNLIFECLFVFKEYLVVVVEVSLCEVIVYFLCLFFLEI